MIVFEGSGILLDIEGTTSSIAFVHEVLFGHAKRHVGDFLATRAGEPAVRELMAGVAAAAGLEPDTVLAADDATLRVALAAVELMNRDVKNTALKALQGMIWREGFESGELVAPVFDDVPPALARWADSGLDVRIYSSGSIEAQQLYFRHTAAGDLTGHLRGHYDTTTGPKRESASYTAIAADMDLEPRRILFVSDVGAELDAARRAGMATALAIRPGNATATSVFDHPSIESFAEIVT